MLTFTPVSATLASANVRKAGEWDDHLPAVRKAFGRDAGLQTLRIKGGAGVTYLYHRDDPEVGA